MSARRPVFLSVLLIIIFTISLTAQDKPKVKPQVKPQLQQKLVKKPVVMKRVPTNMLSPAQRGMVAGDDSYRELALAVSRQDQMILAAEMTNPVGGNRGIRAAIVGRLTPGLRLTPGMPYSANRPSYLIEKNFAVAVGNYYLLVYTDRGSDESGYYLTYYVAVDPNMRLLKRSLLLRDFIGNMSVAGMQNPDAAIIAWDNGGTEIKAYYCIVGHNGNMLVPTTEITRHKGAISGIRVAGTERGTAIVLFNHEQDGLYTCEVGMAGMVRTIQPAINNESMTEAVPLAMPGGETMIIGNRNGTAQCIIIGQDDKAQDYPSNPKPVRANQILDKPVRDIRAALLGDSEVFISYFLPGEDNVHGIVVYRTGKPVRGPSRMFAGYTISNQNGSFAIAQRRDGSVLAVGYGSKGDQYIVLHEIYR